MDAREIEATRLLIVEAFEQRVPIEVWTTRAVGGLFIFTGLIAAHDATGFVFEPPGPAISFDNVTATTLLYDRMGN